MHKRIWIDGAEGEGGGQILRTALSLSILTRQPFEMIRIRARRRNPGLRPQHLAAVRAAAALSEASVAGDELGSDYIRFSPQTIRPGEWRFDIGTAGSVSLLLQTLVFPLSFASAPSRLILTGGTHVPFSPPLHFVTHHWLPLLNSFGFRFTVRLERAGFYPRGGGKVVVEIEPVRELSPWTALERGELAGISGFSFYANLPESVGVRQTQAVEKCLSEAGYPHAIETIRLLAVGKNTFVCLLARFTEGRLAATALGERGTPAELIGKRACDALLATLRTPATTDIYLADQLLLPLSLVPGTSRYVAPFLSAHMRSNRETIRKFLPAAITMTPHNQTEAVAVRIEGSFPPVF